MKKINALPVIKMEEPNGALFSAGDRFKEHESGKRSIAMIAMIKANNVALTKTNHWILILYEKFCNQLWIKNHEIGTEIIAEIRIGII